MSEVVRLMVEIDEAADVAYLRFGDRPVARTDEFTEAIQVDLDEFDVAVGIELLDLAEDLPIAELVALYHIPGQVAALLLAIEQQASSGRTTTSSGAVTAAAIGTVKAGSSPWTVVTP
jgi:uncharacterized protein YuzE